MYDCCSNLQILLPITTSETSPTYVCSGVSFQTISARAMVHKTVSSRASGSRENGLRPERRTSPLPTTAPRGSAKRALLVELRERQKDELDAKLEGKRIIQVNQRKRELKAAFLL